MNTEKFELREFATAHENVWRGTFGGVDFEVSLDFDYVFLSSEGTEETEEWRRVDGEWVVCGGRTLTLDWEDERVEFVEAVLEDPASHRVFATTPTLRRETRFVA